MTENSTKNNSCRFDIQEERNRNSSLQSEIDNPFVDISNLSLFEIMQRRKLRKMSNCYEYNPSNQQNKNLSNSNEINVENNTSTNRSNNNISIETLANIENINTSNIDNVIKKEEQKLKSIYKNLFSFNRNHDDSKQLQQMKRSSFLAKYKKEMPLTGNNTNKNDNYLQSYFDDVYPDKNNNTRLRSYSDQSHCGTVNKIQYSKFCFSNKDNSPINSNDRLLHNYRSNRSKSIRKTNHLVQPTLIQ